jgi:hypothetical protein
VGVKRGRGVARHQQAEIRHVARFVGGQAESASGGGGHRLARRWGVAAFQQGVRAGGVREGEGSVADGGRLNASIAPECMLSLASQPWT